MATNYPVNPRVRAYGKARLDLARRAHNGEEWKRIWKPPMHPYPFCLGGAWKQCIEYKVEDFAAEVGFFIDVLGLEINSLDPGYAQFTSPNRDFYFAVVQAPQGYPATPPDALRIQFMVEDIFDTAEELESRGIIFEIPPQPCQAGSALNIGSFLTPHGITIELWGIVNNTVFSHYAESEDELYELMSCEEEPVETEVKQSEMVTVNSPVPTDEDDEEEFFPGLHDQEIESKPAVHQLAHKTKPGSSSARGNIPTITSPHISRPTAAIPDDDAYIEVDEDEEEVDEVEYVDEVDGT